MRVRSTSGSTVSMSGFPNSRLMKLLLASSGVARSPHLRAQVSGDLADVAAQRCCQPGSVAPLHDGDFRCPSTRSAD